MKVVIADDEKMALVILKKLVDWEALGLTLEGEARDGGQLLELIGRVRPDIVVTDIKMPVIDGLEIIAKTLEMGQSPYFLITSAYADFTYARRAMRLNVEDFLPKPVDKEELNGALKHIAEKIRENGGNSGTLSCLIRNARIYIDDHYGEKLTLEQISQHFYISPNYFSSLFKKETGVNFLEYLTGVRMREAAKLLADPKYSIREVALMTGYRDVSHFGASFAKKYGMTPSAWRRKN